MSITAKGFDKLLAKLKTLEKKQARAAMRKAFRSGTAIVRKAVKAATPKDEGVLRRMQDAKVSNKALGFIGIVGASVGKLKEAQASGVRPSNIDWLVEYGHVTPDGTFVRPSGYMRKASAESMPRAEAKIVSVLKSEIEQI